MQNTNWSKYKKEIMNLSGEGKSSNEILEELVKKHGKIFPKGADRRIRELVPKNIQHKNNNAKILVFDIETHPIKGYFWNKYPNYIDDEFIAHGWGMLSWSAKWLFDDKIMSDKLNEKELKNLTTKNELSDERITKSLWELFDEADILIAHNLEKFDEKRANTKFLYYKLPRPSPYQTIDTLKHLRKRFELESNRLDYAARKFFKIEGKLKTEKGLWAKCMNGDYEALKFMEQYNIQDVYVLETMYLEMRSWIFPHPNLSLQAISDSDCCPCCSSTEKIDCKTPYRTYVNEFDAFRCGNCGHIYRSRTSNTPIKSNKKLKVSIPK